jgi:hypothetical protein
MLNNIMLTRIYMTPQKHIQSHPKNYHSCEMQHSNNSHIKTPYSALKHKQNIKVPQSTHPLSPALFVFCCVLSPNCSNDNKSFFHAFLYDAKIYFVDCLLTAMNNLFSKNVHDRQFYVQSIFFLNHANYEMIWKKYCTVTQATDNITWHGEDVICKSDNEGKNIHTHNIKHLLLHNWLIPSDLVKCFMATLTKKWETLKDSSVKTMRLAKFFVSVQRLFTCNVQREYKSVGT